LRYEIPYQDTNGFSKLVLDYLNQDEGLKGFVNHFPEIENFEKQIEEKQKQKINRPILVDVLKRQNIDFLLTSISRENINMLSLENTFTVTTGHQLCLFSGPLYVIYKIISVINLCEKLREKYPTNNFIPIFWMATEDHDFKEVNHIHLFGRKIEWDSNQNGPVGRMSLDKMESVISDLKLSLGTGKNACKLIRLFESAYLDHANLADATRYLLNEIFGKYGLLIIDGDEKDLKKEFIPQIKKDILSNGFFDAIKDSSNRLAKNYKVQAFFRNKNFFSLSDNKRELVDSSISEEIIENKPEMFSPNVLLRCLYQESILPNIAYIGGGSELAYWMQLKNVFDEQNIVFPILILRNSALLITQKQHSSFDRLGFQLDDLFLSLDKLYKMYLLRSSESEISLEEEKKELHLIYQKIISKVSDVSLQQSVQAQLQKQFSYLQKIQEKFIRIEKGRSKTTINQIEKIKRQLFPNNTLQERYNNLIPFYLENGDNFIKILKNNLDPLNPNFVVLTFKD